MIRLKDLELSTETAAGLADLQRLVDVQPAYSDRITEAQRLFASRNVRGNRTFDRVKETLDAMCAGARRCAYCEDSIADEIEHIWPKNIYPERTFHWPNLLYACGSCNSPKGASFAIYLATNGRRIDVTPKRGVIRQSPPKGSPLLIDPRVEDPLDFLAIDLLGGTFQIRPRSRRPSKSWQRAIYTIEILHLSDREPLNRARGQHYSIYKRYLGDYIRRRDEGEKIDTLDSITTEIRELNHPMVWKEMQRQWKAIPELQELFSHAPEALGW